MGIGANPREPLPLVAQLNFNLIESIGQGSRIPFPFSWAFGPKAPQCVIDSPKTGLALSLVLYAILAWIGPKEGRGIGMRRNTRTARQAVDVTPNIVGKNRRYISTSAVGTFPHADPNQTRGRNNAEDLSVSSLSRKHIGRRLREQRTWNGQLQTWKHKGRLPI